MTELDVEVIPQKDKRLGRQKVHDAASRGWPLGFSLDRGEWRTKSIRVYDPRPNPNQCHGECTCTTKCMQFNSIGNRIKRQILNMDMAHKLYAISTTLDPWPLSWPPDDTGSSGLASCKAAQKLNLGGEYRHVFRGADEVVELIQRGHPVSVGTKWTEDMFDPDHEGIVEPTGEVVGGHQYLARRYELKRDLIGIRCWWGEHFRDVWIHRTHLNDLIMDGGDAHVQDRKHF